MLQSNRVRLGWSIIAALALPAAALAQASTKPADAKPSDTKPAAAQPADAKPAETKPAADLPSAKSIHEKYLAAVGGRAAMEKIKARVVKGKLEVPAAGLKGTLSMFTKAPAFARMSAEIEGAGTIDRGTDGKTAWEVGMAGPRILEGSELTDFVRSADLLAEANAEKYYKLETVGAEKVGDADTYKVQFTDVSDPKVVLHQYYDSKSGLLLRRSETMRMQMGDIASDTFFETYKKFGDLMAPVTTRQKMMNMEQIMTIDSVEYPDTIADDKFEAPKEIKELLAKPAKPAGEPDKKDAPAGDKPVEKPADKPADKPAAKP